MPANYSILPHLDLVCVRYDGVLTAEESMDLFVGYITSREARAGRPVFVDMSGLERMVMGDMSLMRYAQAKMSVLGPDLPPLRLAFYARTPHQAALAKAYAALVAPSGRIAATVHADAPAALHALGVSQAALDAVTV